MHACRPSYTEQRVLIVLRTMSWYRLRVDDKDNDEDAGFSGRKLCHNTRHRANISSLAS